MPVNVRPMNRKPMKAYRVRFRAPEPTAVDVLAYGKRNAVALARELFARFGCDAELSFSRDERDLIGRNWQAVEASHG